MLKDGLHALLLRLMQPRLMRWRQALAIIVVVQAIGAALVLLRLDLNNAPELYFPTTHRRRCSSASCAPNSPTTRS